MSSHEVINIPKVENNKNLNISNQKSILSKIKSIFNDFKGFFGEI